MRASAYNRARALGRAAGRCEPLPRCPFGSRPLWRAYYAAAQDERDRGGYPLGRVARAELADALTEFTGRRARHLDGAIRRMARDDLRRMLAGQPRHLVVVVRRMLGLRWPDEL